MRWIKGVLFLTAIGTANAQVATDALVGHWTGDAKMASNWTKAKLLAVDIVIARDDRVTGIIGNAKLVDGRLRSNRSWLTRALNWKTDFIIEGTLDGAIIAAENITRESVKIPMDLIGDQLDGAVFTSGSMFGTKTGQVVAGKMRLTRGG